MWLAGWTKSRALFLASYGTLYALDHGLQPKPLASFPQMDPI